MVKVRNSKLDKEHEYKRHKSRHVSRNVFDIFHSVLSEIPVQGTLVFITSLVSQVTRVLIYNPGLLASVSSVGATGGRLESSDSCVVGFSLPSGIFN